MGVIKAKPLAEILLKEFGKDKITIDQIEPLYREL